MGSLSVVTSNGNVASYRLKDDFPDRVEPRESPPVVQKGALCRAGKLPPTALTFRCKDARGYGCIVGDRRSIFSM